MNLEPPRPFRCLTILLGNRCPLQCAHCGPGSGPGEKGEIDFAVAVSALEEARARRCEVVNFSGGEPFLAAGLLERLVRAAAERGLLTRITTGGYWSSTPEAAEARLAPLARAGLRQLYVSCSDEHQRQVPFASVLAATRVARRHGIDVTLVAGTTRRSKTSLSTLRRAFEAASEPIPWLLESPLIPFGRGASGLPAEDLLVRELASLAGPCPSLGEHPTLHPDGTITGCAVVFGRERPALACGRAPEESLRTALARLDADPLATFIRHLGVVALKTYVEARTDLRFGDRYVNICHLCGDLLGRPEAVQLVRGGG